MTAAETRPTLNRTLVALLVLAALSVGFMYAAPWLLPVWIANGPLVQAGADFEQRSLSWYASRPAGFTITFTTPDETIRVETPAGVRHEVAVPQTPLDAPLPYAIALSGSGRTLFSGTLRPFPDEPGALSFAVFGDSGKAHREQFLLAQQMLAEPLDFMLHTGDVVYPDGSWDDYPASFFAPYRKLLAEIPFFPCVGNHDLGADGPTAAYREVFVVPENGPVRAEPERHYFFDVGPARIAVIDSNIDAETLTGTVAPWLATVFADSGQSWHFLSLHHPLYSAGKYEPSVLHRQTLVPIVEGAGIDIVFAGHDHNYQRIGPLLDGEPAAPGAGVLHVISGAGGARLYAPRSDAQADLLATSSFDVHSFTHVQIVGDTLTGRQIDVAGTILDEWTLTPRRKGSPAPREQEAAEEIAPAPPTVDDA
jgi:acid phosphatase type 7